MTVQKRQPSREEVELQAIIDVAQQLLHRWSSYVAAEAALAAPTMRAAGGGNGRSSDVPDPTYAIVASLDRYTETREAIPGTLGQLRWIQSRMQTALLHHPDIARDRDDFARANRCSGEVDATCNGPREPGRTLCAKCRKRRQRERARGGPGVEQGVRAIVPKAATFPVSSSDPCHSPGQKTAQARCLRCDFVAVATGSDDAAVQAQVLAELDYHRATDCPAVDR